MKIAGNRIGRRTPLRTAPHIASLPTVRERVARMVDTQRAEAALNAAGVAYTLTFHEGPVRSLAEAAA